MTLAAVTTETCWCVVPSPGLLTRERCGDPATDVDGLCDFCRADCQQRARHATGTEPETSAK